MSMKLFPQNGEGKIAIIDPNKKFGEDGQYVTYEGSVAKLLLHAANARLTGMEIRWYFRDLDTDAGEQVATQIIVTDIPPRHVQPFHTHQTLHEASLVLEGEIMAVDSDTLSEDSDFDELVAAGRLISPMHLVMEGPGTRHTVLNPSDTKYARFVTTQTARILLDEFPHDWHRDGK